MSERQTTLSCGCGLPAVTLAGFCAGCARRVRLSREKFAGLRESALQRDAYQCRGCGEFISRVLVVHHRRPGQTQLRLLVTLCRRCHVRVHRRHAPALWFSSFLLELWRELHRGWPEQRRLPFLASNATAVAFQDPLFSTYPELSG